MTDDAHFRSHREPYEVILGKGLLDTAGERLKEMLDPETAVIVADSHTGPLFREKLEKSLKNAGISNVLTYEFQAGEARKTPGPIFPCFPFWRTIPSPGRTACWPWAAVSWGT